MSVKRFPPSTAQSERAETLWGRYRSTFADWMRAVNNLSTLDSSSTASRAEEQTRATAASLAHADARDELVEEMLLFGGAEEKNEVVRCPVSVKSDVSQDSAISQEEQAFESRWRAWQEAGRSEERWRVAMRLRFVKVLTLLALLVTLLAWSRITEYESIVRFLVVGGSVWAAWHAFADREYGWAAIFTLLVVAYNPLVPFFVFEGGFAFSLVVASAIAFAVSLLPPRAEVRLHELPRRG